MSIAENIKKLNRQIEDATQRSGRNPSEIKLLVVTKTHSVETIGQLDYQRKLASDLELELVEPSTLLELKSA